VKITWKDENRTVAGVGLMETGKPYDVSDAIGLALIKQGQAVEGRAKPEKIKKPEVIKEA
jgi:hypothetical protein